MQKQNNEQLNKGTDLNETAAKTVENLSNKHKREEGMSPIDAAIAEEKYDNNPLQTRIEGMRTRTDSLYRTVKLWGKSYPPGEVGRYISLASTSLESARHFFGKMLKEKGVSYPYAKDKSSPTVAGQGEALDKLPSDTEEAARFLRDKIEEEVIEMLIYADQVAHLSVMDFLSQNAVIQKLVEAKCWLGEILGVVAREREAK